MDRLDGESISVDSLRSSWHVLGSAPVLIKGTVHLWRIPLDAQPEPTASQCAVLSNDERARAARFHFPKDRRAYAVAHAALRVILSLYIGGKPADARFDVGPYGKPTLVGGQGPHFNLTHSGALAVVGVSSDRALGVDIEQVRAMSDMDSVAARVFTTTEQTILRRLPPLDRQQVFFDGWTRKEAVMKALGLGVAQPPESIEVSLEAGNPVLRSLAGRPTPDWTLTAFAPGPDYTGAVAMQGPPPYLSFYDWSDDLFGGVT